MNDNIFALQEDIKRQEEKLKKLSFDKEQLDKEIYIESRRLFKMRVEMDSLLKKFMVACADETGDTQDG